MRFGHKEGRRFAHVLTVLALAALAHTACYELAHTVSVVERARFTGSGTIPKVERSHPVNTWVTTLRFWDLPFCCCGRVQRHVLPRLVPSPYIIINSP